MPNPDLHGGQIQEAKKATIEINFFTFINYKVYLSKLIVFKTNKNPLFVICEENLFCLHCTYRYLMHCYLWIYCTVPT